MMRLAAAAVCLLSLGLMTLLPGIAETAAAHELWPEFLQIREIATGSYDVLWKVPNPDIALGLTPVFPANCRATNEPRVSRTPIARVERWTIECDGGLEGGVVEIDGLANARAEVLVRIEAAAGGVGTSMLRPGAPSMVVTAEPSTLEVAWTYARLGTAHILAGIDHLLFVFALLLLVESRWLLVKTITAFTVAHSITLGMATLGFVRVPPSAVEAVIALSIVFIAAELVYATRGAATLTTRYPWIAAFGFGLLHGLGFAGALTELGLPAGDVPVALLFFNIGVEIGQLLFVGLVLALAGLAARLNVRWPRWAVAVPPYAIGIVAAYWFVGRFATTF